MVRCPACGFESPDAAQWCDFCKEPFRKPRPAAAPAPAPTPTPIRQQEPDQEFEAGIPPEFLGLDAGGEVPVLPPWVRYAAWSTLCAAAIALAALLTAYLSRQNERAQDAPVPQRLQAR